VTRETVEAIAPPFHGLLSFYSRAHTVSLIRTWWSVAEKTLVIEAGEKTAGPSTALRSGRDDNSDCRITNSLRHFTSAAFELILWGLSGEVLAGGKFRGKFRGHVTYSLPDFATFQKSQADPSRLHPSRSRSKCSETRMAFAMIVSDGFTALADTKQEASTT